MAVSLAQVVDLPAQSTPRQGGLLAAALPAPDGWERGLAIPFYGCGEPILRDKCVTAVDVAHRAGVAEFPAFPIEQGSTCSTLSQLDHEEFALARLNATTEWALGRQLATDQVGTGAASFLDSTDLGAASDVVAGIGCLEEEVAMTGFGSRYFLHASPRTAAALRDAGMMNNDGRSPSGARWIISPGYAGLEAGRVWATGPVWAGTSVPDVHAAVGHRTNDDEAFALRAGIVAFDPCVNISLTVPVGDCPTAP